MISLLVYHGPITPRAAEACGPTPARTGRDTSYVSTPNSKSLTLPRYTRPREDAVAVSPTLTIPYSRAAEAIENSALSPGSRTLLRGLLRTGAARVFPGGGAGIEYGSLLKTAARPDYVAAHVREAAAHLHAQAADLLVVPGMSGYPIGAMYALAAGIPALLLKKSQLGAAAPNVYPTGSFVIPSYTGEGDVVMQADPAAVADIVATIVERKLAEQTQHSTVDIELRIAGGDDIIDKATMSRAVGESALVIGEAALRDCVARHRARTGDDRQIAARVSDVAFVTPLIKVYNNPYEHLWQAFGLRPFAGIDVTSVCLDPPAIGVAGVGTLAFASTRDGAT
jgi:hypothetical protein